MDSKLSSVADPGGQSGHDPHRSWQWSLAPPLGGRKNNERSVNFRDVNKDLTPKDQDKDLKYVLKESLRTRTRIRTTARQIILIAHINLSNVQW